ncbi:MAG: ABC transporter substrate-binding protein [Candidatus Competibacteraceae bacterium]|nr:ABC transporter substrate-binding protein [Candidatus Competibacteraceae bacterium]
MNTHRTLKRHSKLTLAALGLGGALGLVSSWVWAQETGITDKVIRIGSTTQLEGEYKYFGQSQKQGMTAALNGQSVQKRTIEFTQINDFYEPAKAVEGAKQLIEKGIFAMVLSGGTGTAKAVLPVLAEHKIPAFGFYNGAGFTGPGDVLNFRVSYAKEVETAADTGIAIGLKPTEICAYVQNDGYGMSGLSGLRAALAKHSGTEATVAKLDQILNMPGDNPARNNIGPVGVYKRDTSNAREGYMSLKKWETDTGVRCRLIVTTALYNQAVNFIAYVIQKGEPWIFSSVSAASGDLLASLLKEKAVKNSVIFTTQVVPPLDSPLPVVVEARKALNENLNVISLEGYMIGKLFVAIMQAIDGPLTRENFLKAARRQPYDLGGVKVDFTTDNQGSDFVGLTVLKDDRFVPTTSNDLAALIK